MYIYMYMYMFMYGYLYMYVHIMYLGSKAGKVHVIIAADHGCFLNWLSKVFWWGARRWGRLLTWGKQILHKTDQSQNISKFYITSTQIYMYMYMYVQLLHIYVQ